MINSVCENRTAERQLDSLSRANIPLVDICQAIHSCVTGSGSDLSDTDLQSFVLTLEQKLQTWYRASQAAELYDTAIQMLVTAALAEGRAELQKRSKADA